MCVVHTYLLDSLTLHLHFQGFLEVEDLLKKNDLEFQQAYADFNVEVCLQVLEYVLALAFCVCAHVYL